MNLWEKVKESLHEGGQEMADQPVEVVELSKMHAELNELRRRVRDNFTALGGEIYVLHTTKKWNVLRDLIKNHVKNLEELRQDLEAKERSFEQLREKYEAQSVSMLQLKQLKAALEAADACLEHLIVESTWPVVGRKLCELELPKEILLGLIIRNGMPVIPDADTKITGGDEVILMGKKEKVLGTLSNFQPSRT